MGNFVSQALSNMYTPRATQRVTMPRFRPVTSIVVPVMNESANVMPLVQRVQAAMASIGNRPTEILFVDDSRDELTVQAVMLARMAYRSDTFNVRIFHRVGDERWGGLSGAVADGMRMAGADQVIVMDGDLQHPPETIPAMVKDALTNDLVVASRYRKGGSAGGLDGGIRHLVSRGSTFLAKTIFPYRLRKVTDPMTGFFLVDRRKIDRSRMQPKGFKILLEICATHPELHISEVPLQFAERVSGESHGTLKQGMEFFSQLLTLRFGQVAASLDRMLRRLPKFVQFGAIGGSVFAFGMGLLFFLVEVLHWSPLLANALQLVVTFWLNYVLNRHVTWRERVMSRLAMHKFLVSRAATTVLNYFLFAWLIQLSTTITLYATTIHLSVNYLAANIITLFAIMALNFEISDRWAFAEPKPANGKRLSGAARRRQQRLASGESAKKGQLPIASTLAGLLAVMAGVSVALAPASALSIILATAGLGLFFQASIEVWRMMYSYRQPDAVDKLRFPTPDGQAHETFCLIVPARHEEAVLGNTLLQLAKQTHPKVQIISVICDDDYQTLQVAYEAARQDPRIAVVEYPLQPGVKPSKPLQLNYVLKQVAEHNYSVIGVVDAEDTVHPELLEHIDTAFKDQEIGIVQGGVQLMNHDSSWYSLHNVLEYYRWFNSAMAFQADAKFMPLGGNTIFIRKRLLDKTGGWPVTLTEDCSLGVLLSTRFAEEGAKTAVYYDPRLATREETPDSLKGLFKQRVRWNQGFFHEWRKGIWQELPSFRQRLLAGYVLLGPVLLGAISIFMVASLLATLFLSAPVGLVMLMYLPLIPVILLMLLNAIFLYDFGKAFNRKVTIRQYIMLFVSHFPYQIVLNAAALWSVIRELRGDQSWYKTPHSGLHRTPAPVAPALATIPAVPMAVEPFEDDTTNAYAISGVSTPMNGERRG